MQSSDDPYEKFILQHLRHYGRFTGQSFSFLQRSDSTCRLWRRSHDSAPTHVFNTADTTDMDGEHTQAHQDQATFNVERFLRTRQLLVDLEGGRPIPRLREPLDLVSIPSSSCPLQAVLWPVECEVVTDKIRHIEWDPPVPEPFYQQTGCEHTPMLQGEEKGIIVYCVNSAEMSYFTRSCVGGNRQHLKNFTSSGDSQETPTLSFESRFESGNLQKAVKIGHYDYELTLRPDMYTTKHTQWFYFRVKNMKADVTYRFTIINLMKSSSLYEAGMRPLLYSELDAELKKKGWHRAGNDIRYYPNPIEPEGKPLYSLTWTLEFPHENDTCYLAHCYPYTYSDLQHYLQSVISDPAQSVYCKVRVLCRSLAGNQVYVLTVTSPSGTWQERRNRQAVVVTARVHPGETNSSWMMQGLLDFLLGKSPDAHVLRETFVFKIVPMLNPDGVVVGNYRCSLTGRDMNRSYHTLLKDSFPCVWYTRNMVKRLLAERNVVLYCDFHGHSRKNNVFMYGCTNRRNKPDLQERVFPLMMSKNAKDKFSFRSCKFKIQKSKEGTGRVVMWRLGIQNSYTLESTFGGSTLVGRRGTHFSVGDLKSMGYHFCDTLLDFCDPDQTKTEQCIKELGALLKQEIRRKLGRDVDSLTDVDIESSTSGSNSTDSDGLPVHLLNSTNQNKVKKKHLRSKKERNRLRQKGSQSAKSTSCHRVNKNIDTAITNEDLVIEALQEKTVAPVKEGIYKKPDAQLVRVNQSERTWISHSIPSYCLAGHEKGKKDKNRLGYTPALLNVTEGSINRIQKQTQHQQQQQQQPLVVTSMHQRLSYLPVHHFPILFKKDIKVYSGMRGSPCVSTIPLHKVVPQFTSDKGLELRRSAYSTSAFTATQKNIKHKRTAHSKKFSHELCMPENNNAIDSAWPHPKRNPLAGLALLEMEQSSEADQLNKHKALDHTFFPDLGSINRPNKSKRRSTDEQAVPRDLRQETLTSEHEDTTSSGSWYSDSRGWRTKK